MLPRTAAIRVFPIPGQQKSLMLGMVQHTAVGQEEWRKFFKSINSIISHRQLNRGDFQVRKALFHCSYAAVL